ncbi:MAG: hypothetical protein EA402_03280 [Planctomycetota bacterium]|nr:MAG: hypothetical protein EA402_03280 [Planctomycetota bacterium]
MSEDSSQQTPVWETMLAKLPFPPAQLAAMAGAAALVLSFIPYIRLLAIPLAFLAIGLGVLAFMRPQADDAKPGPIPAPAPALAGGGAGAAFLGLILAVVFMASGGGSMIGGGGNLYDLARQALQAEADSDGSEEALKEIERRFKSRMQLAVGRGYSVPFEITDDLAELVDIRDVKVVAGLRWMGAWRMVFLVEGRLKDDLSSAPSGRSVIIRAELLDGDGDLLTSIDFYVRKEEGRSFEESNSAPRILSVEGLAKVMLSIGSR